MFKKAEKSGGSWNATAQLFEAHVATHTLKCKEKTSVIFSKTGTEAVLPIFFPSYSSRCKYQNDI